MMMSATGLTLVAPLATHHSAALVNWIKSDPLLDVDPLDSSLIWQDNWPPLI